MFNGDTSLLMSQVIPPSISNQEDTNEITTTNITSQDIVVKELVSDDNKDPAEQSPKRIKIG